MNPALILTPVFAMLLLTLAVWATMYARRIPYLQNLDMDPDEITVQLLAAAPRRVTNPSDNFKNLFELPVIFYVVCLYLYFTGQVDAFYLILAWIFIIGRYAHSFIHCTFNKVMMRFGCYMVGALALWLMVIRAFIAHLRVAL